MGRPKSKLVEKRNEEITELYKNATWTLKALGDKYGLTRERIRQILAWHLGQEGRALVREQRKYSKEIKRFGSLKKYKEYLVNVKKQRAGLRWTRKFAQCVRCHSTENPHGTHGYCRNCEWWYQYYIKPGGKRKRNLNSAKWLKKKYGSRKS